MALPRFLLILAGRRSPILGMLLIFATIVQMIGVMVDAVTPRPDWFGAPIVIDGTFTVSTKNQSLMEPDKVMHAGVYGWLSACALIGLYHATRWNRRTIALITLIGVGACWGALAEGIQGFLPYRNAELFDWLANLLGSFLAVAFLAPFGWLLDHLP